MFALGEHLARHHEALFANVLLRRLMQLLLEKPEKIALADKKAVRNLADTYGRADILVDILQKFRYDRGDLRALACAGRARKRVKIIKKLGNKMRQKLEKDLP
jgi:hypothetical protein